MTTVDEMLDAVREGNLAKVIELLRSDNTLAEAQDDRGDTALLLSLYYRRQEITSLLLSRNPGMSIFEAAALGDAPFVQDAASRHPELVWSYSHDGFTPLHLAVLFGHEEIARFLIGRGADVNAISANRVFARNVTPLHSAVAGNRASLVRRLLESGANPNAVQDGGYTPLHSAAANGSDEIAGLLLSHGADPGRLTDEGKTPLQLASEAGHEAVVARLRAKM